MAKQKLLLPVVSLGAEHLVMGYLMRRNILAYKAPPNNEGYDIICIHPDPRHEPRQGQRSQVRVQVKSRFATDATHFTVKDESLDAFDFAVFVCLNIGRFYGKYDGTSGEEAPEFYTVPRDEVREWLKASNWSYVYLNSELRKRFEKYKNETGFEQVATMLGVDRPRRVGDVEIMEPDS